jgi:hypothetical protein
MKISSIKKYKIVLILYLLIILALAIYAQRDQVKQDSQENFTGSVMLKNKRKAKYSDCKTKCEAKYDDPDMIKVCKSYCKCKKKCNDNKKCQKECREIKMNLYKDDKYKIERRELKDKIKDHTRKENNEIKKEQKKKAYKEQKKEIVKQEEEVSFVDSIIDKYFSENDKDKLINMNGSVKHFVKDFRKVLRLNKI